MTAPPEGTSQAVAWSAAVSTMDAQRLFAATSSGGPPPDDDALPRWIGHYRVLRLLGQGGMGRVVLARDTRLGRLIAIKLLRGHVGAAEGSPAGGQDGAARELANALEDEARTTARLSHPNIVTIHAVGQHDGQTYLALSYVDGASLADRLASGPLTEAEALRICAEVAAGLTAAHREGVTHCDLKPGNVLVGRDGRVQVADFGIARVLDTRSGRPEAGAIVGTPGYMAPEQWSAGSISGATDVWALGLLLYELVAGQHAMHAEDNSAGALRSRILDATWLPPRHPSLSDETWALVQETLQRDPARRPSARQAARRMRALLTRASASGALELQPFPGLQAFDEAHAAFFFGREREIAELLEKARHTSVLPVVGPSGVGKSSLVLAGLVPRLRERGDWLVLSVRPGKQPFAALSQALVEAVAADPRLAGDRDTWLPRIAPASLAADERALNLALHDLADATGRQVLLVVDQLEEVLTHVEEPAARAAALGAVAHAADPEDPAVRVVFTIRDDFLGQAAVQSQLHRVLSGLTVVQPLDEARMVEAIQRAVEQAGARWESTALAETVVRDASRSSSPLPLLQFACASLWAARDKAKGVLTEASLAALGGIDGIIARHADETLAGLGGEVMGEVRELLLALVAPDGTRRVVEAPALAPTELKQRLVDRLVDARLLALRGDCDGGHGRVEIAHEAVVQAWPRLQRWLDQSVDARRAMDELQTVAALWARRGRPEGELWDAEALAGIRQRLGDAAPGGEVEAFLVASGRAVDRSRRRARRIRWAGTAGVTTVAFSAVVAAAVFKAQRDQVQAQTRRLVIAAADVGTTYFRLTPVDWATPTMCVFQPSSQVIDGVAIHDSSARSPILAGERRLDHWTSTRYTPHADGSIQVRVVTTGGPAILRIFRRGCSHVDIPIAHFQGFTGTPRSETPNEAGKSEKPLPLPTCAASRQGMVEIPAGMFLYGGKGIPKYESVVPARPPQLDYLDEYSMDLTELRRCTFVLLSDYSLTTGLQPVDSSIRTDPSKRLPRPTHPVAGVDAYAAQATCAWLGKRLPSSREWTKAARGGLLLDKTRLNPAPYRSLPWPATTTGAIAQEGRANLRDTSDGWSQTSPVKALPAGRSPYGLFGMGGNLMEWTSTIPDGRSEHRIVRDAHWEHTTTLGLGSIGSENERHVKRFNPYGIGIRCASEMTNGKHKPAIR